MLRWLKAIMIRTTENTDPVKCKIETLTLPCRFPVQEDEISRDQFSR